MQPIKHLSNWLSEYANEEHFLFRLTDFQGLFPSTPMRNLKTLLSRAVRGGLLVRPCRGIYLFPKVAPKDGLLLFHIAALLRTNDFNYVSLETILSDYGIISQIPINWITLLSSGRSNIISCEESGTIEFVHTNQNPTKLTKELTYDSNYQLWRASPQLALRDMKRTRRNNDLIDWNIAKKFYNNP